MPIQAAANRLKREITSGEIKSIQPEKKEEVKKEEPKKDDKGGKKGGKKDKAPAQEEVKVPLTQYEIL